MIFHFLSRIRAIVFLIITFTFLGETQTKVDCSALQLGVFYNYPKNSAEKYVIYREKYIAREYDLVKGDSAIWRIDWKNNCTYSLKYISGNDKKTPEVAEFLTKHIFVYTIESVTSDYYVFNGYVDKVKGDILLSDTMWFKEKQHYVSNKQFEPIINKLSLKKARFSDTSRYAVVYLYRPGKLTNSLGNYVVSFDDLPMALMKNNSGYMFKLFQSGDHVFKSVLNKDESKVQLKVEMGKSYYVKAGINWGFHNFKNFKLEMKVMEPVDGKSEFEEVSY